METPVPSPVAGTERLMQRGFCSRHRKQIVGIAAIIFFLASFILIRHVLAGRAKGAVRAGVQDTEDSSRENHEKRLYQGKYINFSVDGSYSEKIHEIPAQGSVAERIWLVSSDVEGKKVAVVVTKRNERNLLGEPSYTMRADNRADYASKTLTLPFFSAVLFMNHQAPFEATAFLVKRGYVVSISVTSLLKNDAVETELSQILESLSFPLW